MVPWNWFHFNLWVRQLLFLLFLFKRIVSYYVRRCLFIKTWALFKAYSDAINFKKTNVTPMTIIKGIGFYLLAEIVSF